MIESIAARLAALPQKPTPELRAMWEELFGKPAPAFNRSYLVSRLTYRLQELHFGGLKPATRAKLDTLAASVDPKATRKRVVDRPIAGTRLVREWQGVEHTVTVLRDGYEYQGRRYASLSPIARAIAGTRWNGPLFFGLRRAGGGR